MVLVACVKQNTDDLVVPSGLKLNDSVTSLKNGINWQIDRCIAELSTLQGQAVKVNGLGASMRYSSCVIFTWLSQGIKGAKMWQFHVA